MGGLGGFVRHPPPPPGRRILPSPLGSRPLLWLDLRLRCGGTHLGGGPDPLTAWGLGTPGPPQPVPDTKHDRPRLRTPNGRDRISPLLHPLPCLFPCHHATKLNPRVPSGRPTGCPRGAPQCVRVCVRVYACVCVEGTETMGRPT